MSHKKKHTAPIPPANQPKAGPASAKDLRGRDREQATAQGAAFEQQDPKRRLGNYETAGEHAFQQPGGKNAENRYD